MSRKTEDGGLKIMRIQVKKLTEGRREHAVIIRCLGEKKNEGVLGGA
jgi:hypothetical protein